MYEDRSPWGPAVIAAVFVVIAVSAVARFADMPAVWIVVALAMLVAGWQARIAALRWMDDDETGE